MRRLRARTGVLEPTRSPLHFVRAVLGAGVVCSRLVNVKTVAGVQYVGCCEMCTSSTVRLSRCGSAGVDTHQRCRAFPREDDEVGPPHRQPAAQSQSRAGVASVAYSSPWRSSSSSSSSLDAVSKHDAAPMGELRATKQTQSPPWLRDPSGGIAVLPLMRWATHSE